MSTTFLAEQLLAISRAMDAFLDSGVTVSARPLDAHRELYREPVDAVAAVNSALASA